MDRLRVLASLLIAQPRYIQSLVQSAYANGIPFDRQRKALTGALVCAMPSRRGPSVVTEAERLIDKPLTAFASAGGCCVAHS